MRKPSWVPLALVLALDHVDEFGRDRNPLLGQKDADTTWIEAVLEIVELHAFPLVPARMRQARGYFNGRYMSVIRSLGAASIGVLM